MILMAARERHDTMPRRFRLIPVDVEAIQITDEESAKRAALWAGGVPVEGGGVTGVYVPTTNEILNVSVGEYLVREGPGSYVKMSAKEFERKYELI
jgi:hypothetical protein